MVRSAWSIGRASIAAAAFTLAVVAGTGDARSESRTLSFKQMHTGETLTVTYKRNGRYDPKALKQINYILRDWRRNEPIDVDPNLIDMVWEVHRATGSRAAVHVLSGYRAPATNAALRARSSGVADNSQHMAGKALDFFLPDVPLAKLRATALRMQGGGVGYYPTSGSPFVHLDTARVRHWPRMTRQQLASLFPDGKTLHIPADGKPMPGHQLALAELSRARSQRTASTGFSGGNLLAALFGGGRNRTPAQASVQTTSTPVAAAVTEPAPAPEAPRTLADAPVPAPRPAIALASAAPAGVPVPLERPMLTASLAPQDPSTAGSSPGARPADSDRLSRGAMEALMALAPGADLEEALPFSATFTETGEVIERGPELVAIDLSEDALEVFVAPGHCADEPTLARMRHPDQNDLGDLLHSAEIVVVNWFDTRPTALPAGRFAGAAVIPLAARTYHSAGLGSPRLITASAR